MSTQGTRKFREKAMSYDKERVSEMRREEEKSENINKHKGCGCHGKKEEMERLDEESEHKKCGCGCHNK